MNSKRLHKLTCSSLSLPRQVTRPPSASSLRHRRMAAASLLILTTYAFASPWVAIISPNLLQGQSGNSVIKSRNMIPLGGAARIIASYNDVLQSIRFLAVQDTEVARKLCVNVHFSSERSTLRDISHFEGPYIHFLFLSISQREHRCLCSLPRPLRWLGKGFAFLDYTC